MTTLISTGRRRCDAKCYDAEMSDDCHCLCEGLNHGIGLDQAAFNTNKVADIISKVEKGEGRLKFIDMNLL